MNGNKSNWLRIALTAALLVLLGATIGASPAAAQEGGVSLWVSTIGSVDEDVAYGVATDDGGNVFVAGKVNTTNARVTWFDADGGYPWSKTFAGTGYTQANDVSVDSGRSAFVIGTFTGQSNFGAFSLTSNGEEDIFVLKLDSNGNVLRAISLGSKQSDTGEAVFVDSRGFVYITGSFEEQMDVDPDPDDTLQLSSQGDDDIFVVRYSNNLDLRRAWSMGGSQDAIGRDIAVDGSGNVYITGDFLGRIDLDHNNTDDEQRSAGDEDIFIVKYNDSAGWVWSATLGGRDEDLRPAVALDSAGNIYLTGTFEGSANVKAASMEYPLTSRGKADVFLVKLASSGSLLWAQGVGGAGSDRGKDIIVDSRFDVHVTGSFQGPVDFDPGPEQTLLTSANGSDDVFVARYGSTGFFYAARSFSGPQEEIGHALARDAANNLVVAGSFQGTVDFDPSAASDLHTAAGGRDAFVTKLARDDTPVGDEAVFLPFLSLGTTAVSSAR